MMLYYQNARNAWKLDTGLLNARINVYFLIGKPNVRNWKKLTSIKKSLNMSRNQRAFQVIQILAVTVMTVHHHHLRLQVQDVIQALRAPVLQVLLTPAQKVKMKLLKRNENFPIKLPMHDFHILASWIKCFEFCFSIDTPMRLYVCNDFYHIKLACILCSMNKIWRVLKPFIFWNSC